ncbi:DNA-directed RNA polymerase, partial [Candidatus Bathyarchaeota archaeon]|nr:DNA-directed RNA polymerase [Candidatus Bathyarchaeota archaeon]
MEDIVRISPDKFNNTLENVTLEALRAKYEGFVGSNLGFVVAVIDVKVSSIGKIIPGDGATHHVVSFTLLSYYPEIQGIVEG